jgi:divalent metal cation (Fe/Co/Zn/Cd) transporter
LDTEARARLVRSASRLEYATIAWNLGEAVFTVTLGTLAGSLALIGFGSDSLVEVFASSVILWHIRPSHAMTDAQLTRRALRLVAGAFLVLSIILGAASIQSLVDARRAGESVIGIIYLALTAVVMFGLAIAKRRLAVQLGSSPLASEASMTFLDGILCILTLTGLTANAVFGAWWADPAAALIVASAALNEARENWRQSSQRLPVSTIPNGS